MVTLDPIPFRNGELSPLAFLRNRRQRILALYIAPGGDYPGALIMHAKRYQRDKHLVARCERLTGLKARS